VIHVHQTKDGTPNKTNVFATRADHTLWLYPAGTTVSAQSADHAIAEITQNIHFIKNRNVTSTEAVLIAHHMKLWDLMEIWPLNNAIEEYAQ
jgi:hypothetical protein